MSKLIITEKNSVAQNIAEALALQKRRTDTWKEMAFLFHGA